MTWSSVSIPSPRLDSACAYPQCRCCPSAGRRCTNAIDVPTACMCARLHLRCILAHTMRYHRPPHRCERRAKLRCVHCTMQVAAHAPPLGNLLTLNLSHNPRLGDSITPPNWTRGDRLPTTTPRKPSAHKWTHAYNGEVYFGESPPGSVLLGGAKALGNALLHHQTLTEVDVSRTGLRDGGCAHLVRGLKNNVSHASILDSVSNL